MKEPVPIDQYLGWGGYLRYLENDKLVHRCVLERYLGRKIRWNHEAHHIDGNKLNNNVSNLQEVTHMQHMAIHQIEDEIPDWISLRSMQETVRILKAPRTFLEGCFYIHTAVLMGIDVNSIMKPLVDAEEALLRQSILDIQ